MNIKKYYLIGKKDLYPLCRSLTGRDTLKTLRILKKHCKNFKILSDKSKKKVFDWTIPPEWNIKKAYVLDKNNQKIIDFEKNNLHVVNYSIPVKKKLKKKKLLSKIYSIKNNPKAIPYVTSYYRKDWGFCTSHEHREFIKKNYKSNDFFQVKIDTKLKKNGKLNYGEVVLKGKSNQEILISTYICHPSMANNELSGPIVSMCLINYFKKKKLNKSLRFIFIPETIGSINYIYNNLEQLKKNVIGGYNLSCIGDERQHSCMLTKYGNTQSDYAILDAYKKLKLKFKIYSFLKRGSDERQYNSPGIDLPIASIFRTKYGEYPEYHTSLDNFDLVTEKGLKGGFLVAKTAIENLLNKIIPKNKVFCEPFMEKRKIYKQVYMSFLQYADGSLDINQISKKLKLKINETKKIYKILKRENLIN